MRIYILLLIISLQLSAQKTKSSIDAIISREMKERKIPGLQIAVVQNGKIVLSQSYGVANLQNNIPVTNTSIFPINSNTKVFTGVAVMQLVEQDKIKLNDPISKYLNDLPAEWQKISLDQLLTHISGLPDILQLLDPMTGNIGPLKTESAIWEKLKTLPLEFKTGEQFSYNQTNYYLLGKIIEKLANQSFTTDFEKNQFQIAHLKNTVFGDSRDIIQNYAPSYRYNSYFDGKQGEAKLTNTYTEFPDFVRTGSGLNSTAEDMANWLISLQAGRLFKKPETLDMMWSPAQFNNGTPTNWARGWGITKTRKKHSAVGMSGGNRSVIMVYPEDNIAIIVLTNLAGCSPEDFVEEIAGCYNQDIVKADPLTYLRKNLREQGFDKAIEFVKKEQKANPAFKPKEDELNDWAYRMMANKQEKEALEIFKLNVYLFPKSWNVYDSYGEILLKMGDKGKAIEMYRKSIELNPKNENGKKILDKISSL